MQEDITSRVLLPGINERELALLLQTRFNSAHSDQKDAQITYGRSQQDWAIKLLYSNNRLTAVLRGPTLREEELLQLIDGIKNELLQEGQSVVARDILFTCSPVDSSLDLTPLFQVLPAPHNAPRPQFMFGDHPFVLEYKIKASQNGILKLARRHSRSRELVLLLNLLMGPIKQVSHSVSYHWVIESPMDAAQSRTLFLTEGYVVPDFVSEMPEYSDLSHLARMKEAQADHFLQPGGIPLGQTLDAPDFIRPLMARYHNLDPLIRDRFLRSCFWYQHAQIVNRHSASAAFLALLNSIEVLIDREKSAPTCEKCGKSLSPSSTQLFIDFLNRFAPSRQDLDSARRRLYRIRGALTHGWDLFALDTELALTVQPDSLEEHVDLLDARLLTRIALLNWLSDH
jgi:hypothetical protein